MKTEYKFGKDSDLLELYYLYTMPDSELVLIVAARKIEGLPEDVSIDKAIDCIIGTSALHPKSQTITQPICFSV